MSNDLSPLSGPVDASGEPAKVRDVYSPLEPLIDELHRHAEEADDDVVWALAFKMAGAIAVARQPLAAAVPSSPAQEQDHRCWSHRPSGGHARRCIREAGHEGEHIDAERQYWTDAALPPSSPVADSPPWQPIKTAPKDGTEVLVWTLGSCETLYHRHIASYEVSAGWTGWTSIDGFPTHPTHWMPLPSAPSPSAGAAKE